jgi:hypothetical protein
MLCSVEMFCGMFVFRRVAAAYLPTRETHAQVNPRIAHLDAFFTHTRFGFSYFDLIEVGASLWHRVAPTLAHEYFFAAFSDDEALIGVASD